jgi:hypothetical protein
VGTIRAFLKWDNYEYVLYAVEQDIYFKGKLAWQASHLLR